MTKGLSKNHSLPIIIRPLEKSINTIKFICVHLCLSVVSNLIRNRIKYSFFLRTTEAQSSQSKEEEEIREVIDAVPNLKSVFL